MNKHTLLSWSLVAITFVLSACGTSPKAKFYILNPIDRNVATSPGVHKVAVKVGPVSIPDTLDQSRIVTRSGSNKLVLNEFNRWGGDIQDDFQRILGENIAILLPTDQVILYHDLTLMPVDFQVVVNVREFDGELGGMVTLNADWSVVHHPGKEKTVTARKSILKESTDGADYEAYVAAQSRLLAKLSTEIADEVRGQLDE